MSNVLANLEPQLVFKYFEEISQIPRGSGNEKEISDYLCDFAKKLNLEYIQDENYNVVIKKKATAGYEGCPGVIIQGHMDMVCEKNKASNHDFLKDPLKLRIVDDMIYATDTTLGADDGVAVAYGMALLAADDIKHPDLEIFLTVDEECAMTGAKTIDPKHLSGKYIINIDSEKEGHILVSGAGGNRNFVTLPLEFKPTNKKGALIEIKGLLGGHSGIEIDRQHANSNKLMGRVLDILDVEFELASVNGGLKQNAIPRECDALVAVSAENFDELKEQISEIQKIFNNEYKSIDPDIKITVSEAPIEKALTDDCKDKAIKLLNLIPYGVQTMSFDIPGLVESSTNLGVVRTLEDSMTFENATRSCMRSRIDEINTKIRFAAELVGANYIQDNPYPAWERAVDSKLEKMSLEIYKNLTGEDAKIVALHGGLECGFFIEKMPHCEIISIGPNNYDLHSPNEHTSISSIRNVWNYILAMLENMNQY